MPNSLCNMYFYSQHIIWPQILAVLIILNAGEGMVKLALLSIPWGTIFRKLMWQYMSETDPVFSFPGIHPQNNTDFPETVDIPKPHIVIIIIIIIIILQYSPKWKQLECP